MDYDQILEMVKRVRKSCAEELKGKQHKIDMNKNGKLDAQDFEHLRKMKSEEVEDVAEGIVKDIKRLATGRDIKSRVGQEIAKSHEALMKGDTKTARKHFNRYDKLDKLANKEQGATKESVDENFANDFLAMAKQKNPNARISTADQRKKEADELAKKRAGLKPAPAGPSGNPRPLGGYDPKSNRSYSEEVDLDEAKAPSGSPFSKDYKSQMPDDQKTSTKTYHDVKKTSTGTVYTKQSDSEGYSKGTGDDAAKKAEPKVKRGRGRPVGSKSGARQAGSASKTDYRGFVTHTLNLPASK